MNKTNPINCLFFSIILFLSSWVKANAQPGLPQFQLDPIWENGFHQIFHADKVEQHGQTFTVSANHNNKWNNFTATRHENLAGFPGYTIEIANQKQDTAYYFSYTGPKEMVIEAYRQPLPGGKIEKFRQYDFNTSIAFTSDPDKVAGGVEYYMSFLGFKDLKELPTQENAVIFDAPYVPVKKEKSKGITVTPGN